MGNPVRQEWCGPPIDGEASAAINALTLRATQTVLQDFELEPIDMPNQRCSDVYRLIVTDMTFGR